MNSKLFAVLYYLASNITGLYLIKSFFTQTNSERFFAVATFLNWKIATGGLLYASSFLVWIWLLSKEDLSTIYPVIVGLTYVILLLVAVFFLKEQMTALKVIGASLILIGIYLVLKTSK